MLATGMSDHGWLQVRQALYRLTDRQRARHGVPLPTPDRRMVVISYTKGQITGWFIAHGIQDAIARAAFVGHKDLADALTGLSIPNESKIELLGGKYVVLLD